MLTMIMIMRIAMIEGPTPLIQAVLYCAAHNKFTYVSIACM